MCLLEEAAAAASSELALHADWQPLGEAHELSADEAQGALEAAEVWEPDAVEADPGALSRQRRTMDIVRLLVAIFGTQVSSHLSYLDCLCPHPAGGSSSHFLRDPECTQLQRCSRLSQNQYCSHVCMYVLIVLACVCTRSCS